MKQQRQPTLFDAYAGDYPSPASADHDPCPDADRHWTDTDPADWPPFEDIPFLTHYNTGKPMSTDPWYWLEPYLKKRTLEEVAKILASAKAGMERTRRRYEDVRLNGEAASFAPGDVRFGTVLESLYFERNHKWHYGRKIWACEAILAAEGRL